MDNPVVSIIIPVYNVEAYLRRCVDSVLAQTLTEIEIILVDDGSPDNCPAICDEYAGKDNRVVVIHQENTGLSGARNAGLNAARGEYAAFVDSDDFIAPEMVHTMYTKAVTLDADVCVCKMVLVENGKINQTDSDFIEPVIACENMDFARYFAVYLNNYQAPYSVCSSIYRIEMIKTSGLYFIDTNLVFSEDSLFNMCVLSIARRIVRMNENYYYYCRHSGSLMTDTTTSSFICKHIRLVLVLKAFVKKCNPRLLSNAQTACLMWDYLRIACTRYRKDTARIVEDFTSISDDKFMFKKYMLHLAFGRAGSMYCKNYNITGKLALHFRLTAFHVLIGKYEKAVTSYFI